MRFSTRSFRAANVFRVLAPATAIMILGFAVSQIAQKGASAEFANDGKIYYYSKVDVTTLADAVGRTEDEIKRSFYGGGMTPCADTDRYYVVASSQALCDNYDLSAGNAFRIHKGGYTTLKDTRLFWQTELGKSRKPKSDGSNLLGSLGAFHVIAFDNLYANNQVFGNIATNNLGSASNNNINHFTVPTISYVKAMSDDVHLSSFAPVNEGNDTSIFVVGSEDEESIGFTAADGGYTWTMNGPERKVNDSRRIGNDGVFLDNVWVDREDRFINLDSMEEQAIAKNKEFTTYEETLTEDDYDFDTSHGTQFVRLADSQGLNVLNVNASDFSGLVAGARDIHVFGYTTQENGQGQRENVPATLLLNVDLADVAVDPSTGKKSYSQGFGIRVCYDSASDFVDNNSVEHIGDDKYCLKQDYYKDRFEHHVIMNYYDSSEPDGVYRGEIRTVDPRGTTQFTLAPAADLITRGTPYQGVIIANNVTLGGDSYYLSLNDIQPLKPNKDCTINVFHKDRKSGEVITGYAMEYVNACSEDAQYSFSKEAALEELGYKFVQAEYEDGGESSRIVYNYGTDDSTQTTIENGEIISKDLTPIGVWNDLPQKTINFYYDEMCELVVHHKNYTTGQTIRDDEAIPYVCGEIAEVGHAEDLMNAGYIPVLSDGGDMPAPDEKTPIGVVDRPTEIDIFYKTKCKVTVMHRHAETAEFLPTSGDNPREVVGYCGEFEETVNIASELLTDYEFVEGYEINTDEHYKYTSDFPLDTGTVKADLTYVIEYRENELNLCRYEVHHWNEDGTKELADAEYHTRIRCDNTPSTIDKSSAVINAGYTVARAHLDNNDEDITLPYSFAPLVANTDYVFNIYYKKTGTPDTATGKATPIAFTIAGATLALGATLFVRARRQ